MKKMLFMSISLIGVGLFFGKMFDNTSFSEIDRNIPNYYTSRKQEAVEGVESSLWTPVSTIEDGSVYMIRSSVNQNLYWDLTGGNLYNGTEVQLYPCNYSFAQKFILKKQFDVGGYPTYRVIPLYDYDKVLRLNSNTENEILKISSEVYSDVHLFSDKFCFLPNSPSLTQFSISSCIGNALSGKLVTGSIESGQKIKRVSNESYLDSQQTWELIKTDYLGLNVGNKTYVNGANEKRFVFRAPYVGRYVIETRGFGGYSLDTHLRIKRDSDGTTVAFNDDGGADYNALITYDFSTIEEFSIYLRGYNDNVQGYCYLIVRPEKTIYMTGTYDIDNQHIDRVSALNASKTFVRELGYYPEIYANLCHEATFDSTDWEDTLKIDRDYYLFYGHGNDDGYSAAYFDGASPDWASYFALPNLQNAELVIWMMCHGANYDFANGVIHCMAVESITKGAHRSLGFKGEIWNLTSDKFIPKFFEALSTHSISESMQIASAYAIDCNFVWWSVFGHNHCDIGSPVLFTNNRGVDYYTTSVTVSSDRECGVIKEGSFFVKEKMQNYDILAIEKRIEAKRIELESEWDDVLLFLGEDQNGLIPIAMCADNTLCFCKYINLITCEEIDSDTFERIMRS